MADALKENTRESDLVARIGGDEFAVILMQTPTDVAREKTQSLLELIGALDIKGVKEPVTTYRLNLDA